MKVFVSTDIEGTAGIVRMVRLEDDDPLLLYRTFVTVVILTATLVDAVPT